MPVGGDALLNKLILLFVFDKMEIPMTEPILSEMCSSNSHSFWLNYLDCKLTLQQLEESGLVYKSANVKEPIYSITPDGRFCLAEFFANVPTSTREDITKFVKANRTKYRKKQEYVADYFMNNDGTYTVHLEIVEQIGSQLDLKIVVPSRQVANSIYKKWQEKAENVYALIYESLVD